MNAGTVYADHALDPSSASFSLAWRIASIKSGKTSGATCYFDRSGRTAGRHTDRRAVRAIRLGISTLLQTGLVASVARDYLKNRRPIC